MAKETRETREAKENLNATSVVVENTTKAKVTQEDVVKYSKKQLVSAKKNEHIRDIIAVVVGDDELLTIKELGTKVEQFLSMEVR